MHPALRKGPLFYKTPPFSTFFYKKHPFPISIPAYGPDTGCPGGIFGASFCSLAVLLDPRVGDTMDILSPFISVLCHSD